jgi:AraC-like DNA-binding protein
MLQAEPKESCSLFQVLAKHPAVWKTIYPIVLRDTRSTFGALARLASLRVAGNGGYAHAELTGGAGLVSPALAAIHIDLFNIWLSLPLADQRREIKDYCCDHGVGLSDAVSDGFKTWLPASAAPPERLIFEIDLGLIMRDLRAEPTGIAIADQRRRANHGQWAVATAIQIVKSRWGHIGTTLEHLAPALHVSAKHLGLVFREQTGVAFREYSRGLRMCRAAALLHSSLSIREIAETLGYRDERNFRRDFRRAMGRSLAEYARAKVNPAALAAWAA